MYSGVNEVTGELCAIKEMYLDEIFDREIKAMNSIPEHVRPISRCHSLFRGIHCVCMDTQKEVTLDILFLNSARQLWNLWLPRI